MKYNAELADKICEQVAKMVPIRKIAALPDMPSKATILRWRRAIPDFELKYDEAREKAFADWDKERAEQHAAWRVQFDEQNEKDDDTYDAYLEVLANRKAAALAEKPTLDAMRELTKRKPYRYFMY
jgi:uncharacterized lipoprotein YmbA